MTTNITVFVISAEHLDRLELPKVKRVMAFEFYTGQGNGDRMCRLVCEVN